MTDKTRKPLLDGFTRPELAKELGRSPQTLARWASEGAGPAYKIVMGRVFYPREEVEKWINDMPLHAGGNIETEEGEE